VILIGGIQSSTLPTVQANVPHRSSGLPSSRVATLSIDNIASKIFDRHRRWGELDDLEESVCTKSTSTELFLYYRISHSAFERFYNVV